MSSGPASSVRSRSWLRAGSGTPEPSAGRGRRRAPAAPRWTWVGRIPLRSTLAALAAVTALAVVLPLSLSAESAVTAPPTDEVLARSAATSSLPAPARVSGPGTPAGDSRFIDLTVGGMKRGYFLLPALGLPADRPAALLVVLHQDVSSGREIAVDLGLDSLRRQGVTLAYPNGIGGSWNAGDCCGVAVERNVDDVGFVAAVLDDVGRHTSIDAARRALLGYSGGGMLAYRLLCRPHPPLVAAVEISGSLESPCAGTVALPDLLAVHGANDGSVGLTESRYVNHLGMAPRAVVSTLSTVTARAGCRQRTDRTTNGIDVWSWSACRGGGTVQAQIVPGAGHGWADVGGAARAITFLLPRLMPRR